MYVDKWGESRNICANMHANIGANTRGINRVIMEDVNTSNNSIYVLDSEIENIVR